MQEMVSTKNSKTTKEIYCCLSRVVPFSYLSRLFRQKRYTEPDGTLNRRRSFRIDLPVSHLFPIPPKMGKVIFPKWNSYCAVTLLKVF